MWQVCLLVKYNIKAKSLCVRLSLSLSLCRCLVKKLIDTDIFTMHLLTPWVWNDWVSVNDVNDDYEVCLLVKYNIKVKSMCVCVSLSLSLSLSVCVCVAASEEIDTDIFTTHFLTPWVWNKLGQLFREWLHWLGFWVILSQYLTPTYTVSICLRKELQGQKLTSTYLPGRLICEHIM